MALALEQIYPDSIEDYVPAVVERATDLLVREMVEPFAEDKKADRYRKFLDETEEQRPVIGRRRGLSKLLARTTQVISNNGLTLVERDLWDMDGECESTGIIHIQYNLDRGLRFSVLIHEYTHWLLGHCFGDWRLGWRVREIQAEGISYVVSAYMGQYFYEAAKYLAERGIDPDMMEEHAPIIRETAIQIIRELEPWNLVLHVPPGAEFNGRRHLDSVRAWHQ
jgi:hypothetical protein